MDKITDYQDLINHNVAEITKPDALEEDMRRHAHTLRCEEQRLTHRGSKEDLHIVQLALQSLEETTLPAVKKVYADVKGLAVPNYA